MDASVLRSHFPFPLLTNSDSIKGYRRRIDAQPRRTEVDVWQMSISLISLLTSSLASLGQISVDIWFGDLHSSSGREQVRFLPLSRPRTTLRAAHNQPTKVAPSGTIKPPFRDTFFVST